MIEHKCNECKTVFSVESMLNEHMYREHNRNFNVKCNQCGNVFNTKDELDQHVQKRHSENANIENIVLKMSKQMDSMAQRMESLERSSLTNFPNLPPPMVKK